MDFDPRCMVTAIGSFPHKDPDEACDIILRSVPEIPVWPQLPNTDFREQMEIQYSEGMPCAVVDEAGRKMYFDTGGDITGDLEEFYGNVLAGNLEYFRISPAFSRGIYRMEERLSGIDRSSIRYFKNQVTGPITFGLNRVDENKRSIYYNEIFRDVVVKCIAMKTRWLLKKFSDFGFRQMCFVDEPIFSAFGSSTYVSVQRPDVVQYLKEVVDAIHEEGAIAGSHCCGNTEWTILIDAGVDIISFDAYEYGETIGYYPEKVSEFLTNGGVLAWGIVPTSEKINDETPESIVRKLEGLIGSLVRKGLDENLIWDRCLITPSCGTGSRSVELAEKTFRRLSEVGGLLRR